MASKKTILRIGDYSDSFAQIKLPQLLHEVDGLYNMHFNKWGRIVKRNGYTKYNTNTINADHAITGLHRFYKQNTTNAYTLVACNTSIYKLADTTGHAASSIKSGLTADSETHFADYQDHCYIANGAENLMKYDGNNVRDAGIEVPAAPTFDSNIDGSLEEGTYHYKVTYVDEDGYEGNPSEASAAMSALADPNDGIKIVIPVSTDSKITKRRIYRTAVNGARYYYDGEVADNTTTVYNSTSSDDDLVTLIEADHDAPPAAPDNVYKRLSRLMVSKNHELYISNISYPEYMPSGKKIPTGNREKIKGMAEQLHVLQVLTENAVDRLVGTDFTNFEYRKNYCSEGSMASRSIVLADNALVYLGFDGIYIMKEVNQAQELNPLLSDYITANINRAYIGLSSAVYYDHKYFLSYPKGTSVVPNETIYYDFRTGNYGVYNFGFNCYTRLNRGIDSDILLAGSATEGRVYEYVGLDDDGANIEAYFETMPINFGYPELKKKVYDIYLKLKTTTGTNLRLYYTLDNRSETYKDKTLIADTTQWHRIRLSSGGYECREIRIRPYMNDKYNWEIHGIGIVYQLGEPEYA
ncbi:MAG: hypothetical protein ACOWWR_18505 [Eubacteriales bacterium]